MERDDLRRRLDTVESAYEYMLAFAAQGLPAESSGREGGRIRGELDALAASLDGLQASFERFVAAEAIAARAQHQDFQRVLADDAGKALAAVRLVLAQPGISSQLVDNLNASLHVRALLTDVFLLDEILKVLGSSIPAARGGAALDPQQS
ncbi:MAG TPA: hypothetical protein VHR17_04790 [Thermoanaerobaculia bacterium]|jgi:hypothetical protein|nr:hypothetical protein [Thermoanaerobaculia bacterium]